MEKLLLKYRTWYRGLPPRPIRLSIPGWAGDSHAHCNGAKPQPWHCIPFVEGSAYGLEVVWPFDEEMKISTSDDGKLVIDCKWGEHEGLDSPPIKTFAPGHYGITSCLDIMPPEGYVIRTEAHPSYFTDPDYSVPCVVPGHIQGEWWPRFFFIVCKYPPKGYPTYYRPGQAYAQLLIVPKKVNYDIKPMSPAETMTRYQRDQAINDYDNALSELVWKDNEGQEFTDKYKVLSRIYQRGGEKALDDHIAEVVQRVDKEKEQRQKLASVRMSRRFIPHK
jgi:hypothetical protein